MCNVSNESSHELLLESYIVWSNVVDPSSLQQGLNSRGRRLGLQPGEEWTPLMIWDANCQCLTSMSKQSLFEHDRSFHFRWDWLFNPFIKRWIYHWEALNDYMMITKETNDVKQNAGLMLASVVDGGPTLTQHVYHDLCLLGISSINFTI